MAWLHTKAFGIIGLARALNQCKHHKGVVTCKFNNSTGDYQLQNNFRGEVSYLVTGSIEDCREFVLNVLEEL